MGDYARAEPLCKQSQEITKQVLREQHPLYATSLSNLAGLYKSMGDYARAEPLYKQSQEITKQVLGDQHPSYAASLNNLAALYERMGDYARVEPLFKQSREILKQALGEQHPDYATSLNNLAMLYVSMGDYGRAEPLYKQSQEIRKQVLGDQHPDYATSLNNLAGLYCEMRDYARAEPLYNQSRDIRKQVLGEQHPDYATSLNNLASLYQKMGDYARAEPLFKRAVDIQRKQLNHTAAVQSARQQNRNQQTNRHYLDGRLANTIGSATPDAASSAADLWQWKGAVTARQQAYRKVASDPKLAPLFAELRSLTQQLSVASGQIPIPPPRSATEIKQNTFKQKREIWEQRVARLTREREDLEQQIAAGSLEFRRIQEPLTADMVRSLLPKGTAFVDFLEYYHGTPDPKKKGKTNYERRYLAVVVPSEGAVKLVGLGAADPISEAVDAFRLPFRTGENAGSMAAGEAARVLREALWVPIEQHLADAKTVIVSPDTAIGKLPFAALPGEKLGSYLIEKYKFGTLPLAGMLRSLFDKEAERPQPKKGLLVVGDVDYDANSLVAKAEPQTDSRPAWLRGSAPRGGSVWRKLEYASDEVASVERLFRKKFGGKAITTIDGPNATEAEFIRQAPNHYNLHLVTHGYFADPKFEAIGTGRHAEDSAVPSARQMLASSQSVNQYLPGLLSGIVLAGANTPPTADDPKADGILTASEIETLDLNAVDLVVLSACETGLGKAAGGEGLTGLQRAFHIAGARTCVATLWEVDDKATQEMMSKFYNNYWDKGQSKIDALRNAQLDILRNSSFTRGAPGRTPKQDPNATRRSTEKTDPHFWAAFQLSGDWR